MTPSNFSQCYAEALQLETLTNALSGFDKGRLGNAIPALMQHCIEQHYHGDTEQWWQAWSALPEADVHSVCLRSGAVEATGKLLGAEVSQMEQALLQMQPWRKGPFRLFGLDIDTEWRSDLKWQRLKTEIEPLAGKSVLDVGCGSGYHLWRMLGADAKLVVGVDPSWLFLFQFLTLKKYLGAHQSAYFLPVPLEALPKQTRCFNTVFSMGVLYHRRSPIDHLAELKACLRPGGQLVLETLVVEGDEHQVLVPAGRYARMRNVWFLPSSQALMAWLRRLGFEDVRLVDETFTTTEEQRQTRWMQSESFEQCLMPDDSSKTIEGLPAPKRAVILARSK